MIISPREPTTKTIAIVSSDAEWVYVKFPETNDDFKRAVKGQGYFWGGWYEMRWCKKTKYSSDRHCEIIRVLLENGFIVESDEEHIIKMQNDDYDPEPLRWVKAKDDHFRLCWLRNEDCYDEVRKLPASKYDKPCVIVPMEYYEEVIDFAEINNFKMLTSALELAEQAKIKMNSIVFFNPQKNTTSKDDTEDFYIHPDLLDV